MMIDERDVLTSKSSGVKGLKDDTFHGDSPYSPTKLARFVAGCQCVGGTVHVAFFHDAGNGDVGQNKFEGKIQSPLLSCGSRPDGVPTSDFASDTSPFGIVYHAIKTRTHRR